MAGKRRRRRAPRDSGRNSMREPMRKTLKANHFFHLLCIQDLSDLCFPSFSARKRRVEDERKGTDNEAWAFWAVLVHRGQRFGLDSERFGSDLQSNVFYRRRSRIGAIELMLCGDSKR